MNCHRATLSAAMARKPKGAPSGCFYSSCTGAQLTELLRALGLPVSGAKPDQVARLRAHPAAAPYADEARTGTLSRVTLEWVGARDGATLESIKEECRAAGLRVSGNKFQLVLALLSAAGPGGPRPGDAAKPRAPSTKPAAPESLRLRILAKSGADTDNWSNQRCNEHAGRVFSAAHAMLQKEAHEKGLLAARNPALADAAVAVLSAICDGWRDLRRPGYGDSSYTLDCIMDEVKAIDEQLGAAVSEATRAELRRLYAAVCAEAGRYGMLLTRAATI